MSDGIVEIGIFQDEPSVWLARAELEANGIASEVISRHAYSLPQPKIRLAVREEDVEAARRIPQAAADPPRP
jgi:hypothetical protein